MSKNESEIEETNEYTFKSDYEADWDVHRSAIQDFDSYEAMLIGQVYDSVSNPSWSKSAAEYRIQFCTRW